MMLLLEPFLLCTKLVFGAFLALLSVVGFILQIAGVAKTLDACGSNQLDVADGNFRTIPIGDVSEYRCNDLLRPFWWATCFQMIVIVGTGLAAFSGALKNLRAVALAFLAITTLQIVDSAGKALNLRNKPGFDEMDSGVAVAGYIISAAVNFALLFMVGFERSPMSKVSRFELDAEVGQSQMKTVELPPADLEQSQSV